MPIAANQFGANVTPLCFGVTDDGQRFWRPHARSLALNGELWQGSSQCGIAVRGRCLNFPPTTSVINGRHVRMAVIATQAFVPCSVLIRR